MGLDDSWPTEPPVTNLEALRARALAAIEGDCAPHVAERLVGVVIDHLAAQQRATQRAVAVANQAKAQFLANWRLATQPP